MTANQSISEKQGIILAKKLRRQLADALGQSVQVILFGSYARGDSTAESDIDVLVMLPDIRKNTLDTVLEIAWEIGFEAGKVLSVIPATHEEMSTLSASPFFQTVQREGIPA